MTKRRTILTIASLASAFVLTACGSVSAEDYGTLEGQFVLDGAPLELEPLIAKGDSSAKDAEVCAANGVPDETLVVNPKNQGIANICLYIRKAPKSIHPDLEDSEDEEVVFDQKGCRFTPHLMIVRTDQTVLVKSGDPINHNTRGSPFNNEPFNFIVAPNDRKGVEVNMPKSELRTPPVKVSCDIHPWMSAYWMVTDHPYVAVTDADGKFKIEKIPAGEHTFRVWHERSGYVKTSEFSRDLTVEIKGDETLTLKPFKVPVASFEKE